MNFSAHLRQGLCWPLKRKWYTHFLHYNGIHLHQPHSQIYIKIIVYTKKWNESFPYPHIIWNLGLCWDQKHIKIIINIVCMIYSLMVKLNHICVHIQNWCQVWWLVTPVQQRHRHYSTIIWNKTRIFNFGFTILLISCIILHYEHIN